MAGLRGGVEGWLNKRVSVIFNDGSRVVTHHGVLQSISDRMVVIKGTDKEEAISLDKIVRMELER